MSDEQEHAAAAAAAAAAAPDVVPNDEEEDDSNPFLKGLSILPPLQGHQVHGMVLGGGNDDNGVVPLPPIRAEEPVASIRAALSEVRGYAHLTNYRLVLENPPKGSTTKSNVNKEIASSTEQKIGSSPSDVVSPYTGPDAVVAVPIAVKSLDHEPQTYISDTDAAIVEPEDSVIVLDDYGDLKPLLEKGITDGSAFRVVLERYDAAAVRDHVTRLRALVDGSAPSITSLADDAEEIKRKEGRATEDEREESSAKKKEEEPPQETKERQEEETEKAKEGEVKSDDSNKEKKLREAARKENLAAMAQEMPSFPLEQPIAVDGTNLKDFYYFVCGEEEELWDSKVSSQQNASDEPREKKSKKKKSKGKKSDKDAAVTSDDGSDKDKTETTETRMRDVARRLNELEEATHVKCSIRYSGFHPPPSSRRLMGDLAYLEVTTPGYPSNEPVIHITATPTGFYVNRTKQLGSSNKYQFDPAPANPPCFSHELLDCLLQKSKSLRSAWADALAASKERAQLSATATRNDNPLKSLYRVAVRGDFGGFQNPSSASASQGIDSVVLRPPWLVPLPHSGIVEAKDSWNHNSLHEYNPTRAEEDLSDKFGLDLRGAALRDWNEELQSAREMPTANLQERIDRARMVHKVLSDFGEASVVGTKAIVDGHIAPMNPNEPTRSHVYLHNNIFFSRAVDAGVETFKIARGDRAARKSASRDAQCMGALHRLDASGLYSLATVLVDYLGMRFVCQSIVPGILYGEKTHTLLAGTVEATSPLVWDKEMHELLEESLGNSLMVATRTMPKMPLSGERMAEIEKLRTSAALPLPEKQENGKMEENGLTTKVCGPVEAKGIRGSDQRNYVLDLNRLTPRDANWVPKSEGGTGKWEAVLEEDGASRNGKGKMFIPKSLDDDEWTMAVLRPELVNSWTQRKMTQYLEGKKEEDGEKEEDIEKDDKNETTKDSGGKEGDGKEASQDEVNNSSDNEGKKEVEKEEPVAKRTKKKLTPEDEEYLRSLRMNVNVFLPNMRSMEGIDDAAVAQIKSDEDRTRELASYLWEELLPKITKEIREATGHQLPMDGKNLTDVLHQRGVNCRYLGRLAALAAQEEEKDKQDLVMIKAGNIKQLPRRVMPPCWLELLECEMVARAAKHVLDSYLTESGGTAATQPVQTIASFLSTLVSMAEETAAQTETRLRKEESTAKTDVPDEDDFNALVMFGTGGNGDAVPSPIRGRAEVWEDIEREIGRRYRYTLSLYNRPGSADRALHVPLLRRVCQRTGIRLVARKYAVGATCLCSDGSSSGGRVTASYPISPVDVLDIVPLVKHSAAQGGEGFVPYNVGASVGPPSLHIVLPDAKAIFEAAHVHYSARALPQALDLAQEAASLYQRITDTPLHVNVARCLDLTAAILFEANEPQLAAANAARALGLAVQLGGFDCADAMSAHSTLSHILLTSGRLAGGVRHLRAAIYLMEIMAGPRYVELSNAYHKLGTVYHEVGNGINALRFYQEASVRLSCDRLLEGMMAKSTASALAFLGEFKIALDNEKRAYNIYSLLLGEDHDVTKQCANTLNKYMKLAVDQGTRKVAEDKKRKEEQAADAIASQIEADELEKHEKKKKKGKKKKKKS